MERARRTVLTLLVVCAAPLIAVWQSLVNKNPALALLVAAAWLMILMVGWLFLKVAADSMNRHLAAWGGAFDRLVDQRLSRYGKVYGQWVMDSRRFLDAKGLATVGTFSPELDEVFVDVGLTARAPRQVPPDLLGSAPTDSARRQSIWDFLDQDEPMALAVIGAPGSGKTTLLNHVARRTARTAQGRRRAIPVLLQLRDHAKAVAAEPGMPLPVLIRKSLPKLAVPEPAGWWESRLMRGKCVVLLDGLDEVANADQRRDIVAWVNQQIAVHPRNDFVVTSRPHGYRDAFVESATTLQVLSFTPDQVRRFLQGWYLAVERRATGSTGREVEMLAQEAADDLLDRLAASPALYDFTINPLLLTMIANVHRFRRSLPNSRADLYGEVCQVMLWRRQEAKRLNLNLPGISKERLLAWLAFEMMRSGTRDIGLRQLLDGIRPRLKRVSTDVTPEEFINDVGSNGLLVERERDLYAFAHLTFQEYLAARYIQEHGLEPVLVEAVDDPWWREVTLLYLSGADADSIVAAALRSGTPTALSLAFECAEIGAELAPELRQRLSEVLKNAFDPSASTESRRLVASVLASRNLRRLVPTPSGTRVCPDPVAADLYWLFLQDSGTPPPDGRPASKPNAPVRGVWSTDANAFVRWINALTSMSGNGIHQGAGMIYRLPSSNELDALVQSAGPAAQILRSQAKQVWNIAGEASGPSVWAAPGRPAANVVSVSDLLAAAVTDLSPSGVLVRLITVTAVNTAERLGPTGVPIRQAAEELARDMIATRSGHNTVGLENTTALEDLRTLLKKAHQAATTIDRALRALPGIDLEIAAKIDQTLSQHPIGRVVERLEKAASLGRDVAIAQEWNRDLGVDSALPIARATRDQINRARRRLHELADSRPLMALPRALLHQQLGMATEPVTCVRTERAFLQSRAALGTSLTLATSAVLEPRAKEDDRSAVTRFGAALLHLSATGPEPISVDLGRLSDVIRHLPDDVNRGFSSPVWAGVVLRQLRETATPILGRQRPMTDDAATAIRVPALVLAAEAVLAHEQALATDLRRLAAATCLMRRRKEDSDSLEALVLATA
ncbi:NACHT domain-containing protein [Actinoplanes sp. NPDC051513]|uniref:NACHT domain-containing protein n=1 Tax=Actinoplanes sp. NPDC051513 TaxID=3363908 RepID=UPI0037BD5BEC